MLIHFHHHDQSFSARLTDGIDLSLPLTPDPTATSAWYCPPVSIEPVRMGNWVGEVAQGASVNFRNITFNPHGNGTHTECLGHITREPYTLQQCMRDYFFYARLVSIAPQRLENGDEVITDAHLRPFFEGKTPPKALLLRTLPNAETKRHRAYTETNPPYLTDEAMHFIVAQGIEHLLLDLPSVDRESDGGKLSTHHIFWNYPAEPRTHCTITELFYAPDSVADGDYLLNLMVAAVENDAAPSKPVLYRLG